LVSPAVLDAVVDAAELGPEDHVVEIGAGLGPLTLRVASRAARVVAYEVDPLLAAALREDVLGAVANVRVVEADVLAVDLLAGSPTRVVANLPYQITSPVLERILGDARRPPLAVLMVQQEVAERLTGASRSFLTVFAQAFAEIELIRRVSPRAFVPPPRVASAVVRLRVRAEPLFAPHPQEDFLRLVSDAFRHRRKTLVTALGFEASLERAVAAAAVNAAGLPERVRPEELDVTAWRALYGALAAMGLRRR
jgi:16S rRNA (adenine1518-N6/adenine1519-N6)-dimethyltransferase